MSSQRKGYDEEAQTFQDERTPIAQESPQQPSPTTAKCVLCGWQSLLLVGLLLVVDIALHIRTSTTNKNAINNQRRWVPIVDMLNASIVGSSSTNSDTERQQPAIDLKSLADVGNHTLLENHDHSTLLYEVHTLAVRVLELKEEDGSVQRLVQSKVWTSDDFPLLLHQQQVAHIGGVDLAHSDVHGTELWLATHSDGIHGMGGLIAVDTRALHI